MGLYNDDVDDSFDPTKRKPLQDNLGMGPATVAAPSAMTPITPRIGRSVSDTGVPMYNQGDSVPATGHTAEPNPHLAEINRMEGTGSGVSQVQAKHPFWGGVLRGLDVAASLAVPGFATVVPGTTMHHNALINQQEGLANQDFARAHEQSQIDEEHARSQALLRPPKLTPEEEAYNEEKRQGKNPVEAYTGIKQIGQDVKPQTHEQEEMEYATLRNQATTGALQPEQQARLNDLQTRFSVGPQAAQQIEGRILGELNANPHTKATTLPPELHVLPTDTLAEANAKYNAAKDRVGAATNQQHISVSVAAQGDKGAQSMFVPVDPNDASKGYTLKYVKPGETVTPGMQTKTGFDRGQKEEQQAAQAKVEAQKDYKLALTFASNPSPTNDYALLIRFIGATKPEGLQKLRLNNNEIKLVDGTRGTFGDIEAFAERVRNGERLTPTQRQNMVQTMKVIADSKGDQQGQPNSDGAQKVHYHIANGQLVKD